jgi:hypothetical protein
MNPALVQALQRLLVVGVVGALTAVGLNLTVLNGALGSSALLLLPILTAIISAALKWLGGATVPATNVAAVGYKSSGIIWPHFWSV